MAALLLSQTAEYALRAMTCVTASEGPVRAADIATRAQVPPVYVSKVLRKLVVHGLLTSQKGHHGGFVLARPAAQIRFADVLAAAEFDVDRDVHCAFGWGNCHAASPCPLHDAYAELKRSFVAWSHTKTLADVDAAFCVDPTRIAARSTGPRVGGVVDDEA